MFIRDHRGQAINLDLAATTTLKPTTSITATEFRDARGSVLGTFPEDLDLEKATAPIVPSSGTATVAVFLRVEPTEHRPTAEDIRVECAAIVAYRVTRQGAEPVYLGTEPSGGMFLGVGAGKLLEVATGHLHAGMEEATAAVVEAAQQAFDRDHPDEAPAELDPVMPKVVATGRKR